MTIEQAIEIVTNAVQTDKYTAEQDKAVLLSIQPKWCGLIASGKKTLEVRKTRPKLKTPFKVYIYCTRPNTHDPNEILETHAPDGHIYRCNGKVIGEFVCDTFVTDKTFGRDPLFNGAACMSEQERTRYSGGKVIYGWHISDLVIYDEPKELSKFKAICRHYDDGRCGDCEYYDYANNESYRCEECAFDGLKPITRPPQSWCYVEVWE